MLFVGWCSYNYAALKPFELQASWWNYKKHDGYQVKPSLLTQCQFMCQSSQEVSGFVATSLQRAPSWTAWWHTSSNMAKLMRLAIMAWVGCQARWYWTFLDLRSYCWYGEPTITDRVWYIRGGAGFLPSTVHDTKIYKVGVFHCLDRGNDGKSACRTLQNVINSCISCYAPWSWYN